MNTAVVERRTIDVFLNQALYFAARMREPAAHLLPLYCGRIGVEGKGNYRHISLLFLHFGIVECFSVDPRRCSRLKATHFDAEGEKRSG